MYLRFKHLLSLLFIFFLLPYTSLAATPEPPLSPANYIVDLAKIINDDVEARLNAYLKELEAKTTAQVVVLTIKSLDQEDIESFSLRTAEKWKLGQKGKDNGLLLTIAVEDRRYRFEVGYGLEAILPDSLVGSIGRQYLVPYFRKGDYSSGIFYATLAVIQEIAKHEGVRIKAVPELRPGIERDNNSSKKDVGWIAFVNIIFVLSILILRLLTPRRRYIRWHGGFGGFGSGSFGGGGFGGFGGGGGGFGGGGASGRW